MPNIRLMLWGVLAAILFLNYQTWLHDYEPPAGAPAAQTSAGAATVFSSAADNGERHAPPNGVVTIAPPMPSSS